MYVDGYGGQGKIQETNKFQDTRNKIQTNFKLQILRYKEQPPKCISPFATNNYWWLRTSDAPQHYLKI